MRLLKRLAMGTLVTAVAAYLVACFCLWRWQTRLIFYPSAAVSETPADFGAWFELVRIATAGSDGQGRLDGWWIPAEQPDAAVVLYLHGNGDNIGANAAHSVRLRSLGLSVLLFDYRGYGRSSEGFPSEALVYQDSEDAWNYLVREYHVRPRQIFIYGHSLGGAIAIELAIHHPDAAGLIVESSFTSATDMARRLGVFRFFPLEMLVHERFQSISKVGSLKLPVIFLHGTSDLTVPSSMSQKLFAAAPEPRQLVLIPGGHHIDSAVVGGPLYFDPLRTFVRSAQERLGTVVGTGYDR